MTVQNDLERAVANAKAQMGMYAQFEASTTDPAAKKMWNEMAQDMKRHIDSLTTRLRYLEKNNPLNQQHQQNMISIPRDRLSKFRPGNFFKFHPLQKGVRPSIANIPDLTLRPDPVFSLP